MIHKDEILTVFPYLTENEKEQLLFILETIEDSLTKEIFDVFLNEFGNVLLDAIETTVIAKTEAEYDAYQNDDEYFGARIEYIPTKDNPYACVKGSKFFYLGIMEMFVDLNTEQQEWLDEAIERTYSTNDYVVSLHKKYISVFLRNNESEILYALADIRANAEYIENLLSTCDSFCVHTAAGSKERALRRLSDALKRAGNTDAGILYELQDLARNHITKRNFISQLETLSQKVKVKDICALRGFYDVDDDTNIALWGLNDQQGQWLDEYAGGYEHTMESELPTDTNGKAETHGTKLPPELDNPTADIYFKRAIEFGLMKIEDGNYIWLKTKVLLAFFAVELNKILNLNTEIISRGGNEIRRTNWQLFEKLFNEKAGSLRLSYEQAGDHTRDIDLINAVFDDNQPSI